MGVQRHKATKQQLSFILKDKYCQCDHLTKPNTSFYFCLLVQGDPNVPAGQLTLDIDLRRPIVLPDLEQQESIEELSRLVLGVHVEAQREAEEQAKSSLATAGDGADGACAGSSAAEEAAPPEAGACSDGCEAGPSSTSTLPAEAQPFVLPMGVTARNEVYPRTCTKW